MAATETADQRATWLVHRGASQIPIQLAGPVTDEVVVNPTDAIADDEQEQAPPNEVDEDVMDNEPIPAEGPSLCEDPETSLIGSLSLHMLSEHGVGGWLHLDETTLLDEHQRLHATTVADHDLFDLRFRPARALATAMLRHEDDAQPVPVPV